MSLDLNKLYNDIKVDIVNMPITQFYNENTKEKFTLNPLDGRQKNPSFFKDGLKMHPGDETLKNFVKIKATPEEIYKVIEKFDLDPLEINQEEKKLRKKYLDFALENIETKASTIKKGIESQPGPDTPLYLKNYKDAINLSKRIIKLLIKEIDPLENVMIHRLVIGVLVILLLLSFFMR